MIRKETIQNITDAARIEEVVGDFVSLKKRGVNYIGLCPFHNEKTASFTVSPAKGFFHCFGCGKGGSSIDFIMQHEHLSYPEALKYLAEKYNIEIIDQIQTAEEKQMQSEIESLYSVVT
ncbi:MAG: CHC2 zinc finger domain-containing protein, partial [Bacteroidota bacterium]